MGRHARLVAAILLFGVAIPIALYWLGIGRAPAVAASEARRLVDDGRATLVVIESGSMRDQALDAAVQWPVRQIMAARGQADLPETLRGRRLMLVCPGGIHSAWAATHLQRIGVDAWCVRGGAQEWVFAGRRANPVSAFRKSPVYEQLAIIATFFGVKLVYSVMSALIVLKLWGRRETDLACLRWAMLAFFVGEAACFVNVMAFQDDSVLFEHLHSVGMVISLALGVYALLEAVDQRLIHYSDAGVCAFGRLCHGCVKHADVPCGLRRVFLLLIPATALVAMIPLCSSFRDLTYNTQVVHAMHTYKHPIVHQVYELRVLPAMALVLLGLCFGTLLVERYPVSRAKVLFAAGVGAIAFSYFRLVLVASFIDNQVWFASWEELTELIYVAVVWGLLAVFARGLLDRPVSQSAVGVLR